MILWCVYAYAEPYDRNFDDLEFALVIGGILAALLGLSGAAAHSSWRMQWKVQQLIEPHLKRFVR